MIIIVCGLPGVGKTTFAKELAPLIKATILSTDKIRKELIPKPTYGFRERRLIYDTLILIAKYLHHTGINCILDATFTTEKSRSELKRKLNLSNKKFHIIECICPEDIIISRLKDRKGDYSDADISIYTKMKRIYEPVKGNHLIVDTSQSSEINVAKIAEILTNR